MGVFLVEAIREVYGQMYAMALDEEGEGYVAKVDRLEYECGACEIGEVLLDAEPIPLRECEETIREAFQGVCEPWKK